MATQAREAHLKQTMNCVYDGKINCIFGFSVSLAGCGHLSFYDFCLCGQLSKGVDLFGKL